MTTIRPCDMIKDLTDGKQLWKISVRIVDFWYVQEQHLEMVFMDATGDKIQVTVAKDEFSEWNGKFKLNSTYEIHNFSLLRNNLRYKRCNHPYRLFFTSGTTLREKDFPDIPPYHYQFKKFSDILAGQFQTDLLVDIIGGVHKISSLQPDAKPKKVVFNLKDLSGDIIQCTLWEEIAMKFLNYYNQRSDSGSIIIILTHARIKGSEGTYLPAVSNAWSGSKLLINEDIVDIQDFKKGIKRGFE